MTEPAAHVRVNIVDATLFEGLQDLLGRMNSSPSVRVVRRIVSFDRRPIAAALLGSLLGDLR